MFRTFALVLAVAAIATPAIADSDHVEIRNQTVYYGDLDLDYDPDARMLLARIESATENVCDRRTGEDLTERSNYLTCGRATMRQAVVDVGQSNVSAEFYGYAPQVEIEDDYYEPASFKK